MSLPMTGQFSLRAMLLAVLCCAVLVGLWRAFGNSVLWGAVFVILSAGAAMILKGPWKRAYLLSYLAVYGPFVVMATYTLLYVSCDHCKAATWTTLPYGPGIIPVELVRRLVDVKLNLFTWLPSWLAIFVAALIVFGLTWLVRRGDRWWPALGLTAICC